MRMIGVTDRYDGFVWINPMNVCAVHRDKMSGHTIITLSAGEKIITSMSLDDVIKLIEQELTKPQGVD